MKKTIWFLVPVMLALMLVGCSKQYSPHYAVEQISAIDIVEMEGHDLDSLKNAVVIAHIEEEKHQQFIDELMKVPSYHTSPPEDYLPGICIRIQYANGDYEAVNGHCSAVFMQRNKYKIKFINGAFSKEQYEAFLSTYMDN